MNERVSARYFPDLAAKPHDTFLRSVLCPTLEMRKLTFREAE